MRILDSSGARPSRAWEGLVFNVNGISISTDWTMRGDMGHCRTPGCNRLSRSSGMAHVQGVAKSEWMSQNWGLSKLVGGFPVRSCCRPLPYEATQRLARIGGWRERNRDGALTLL